MRSLLRLRGYIRPYLLQILLALFAILSLTAASLAIPAIIQQVIDTGLAKRDVRLLVSSALLILLIGVAQAILT
jgi:ABC-type bacteriocin/lantibiotic exporter with double-glycine peptidase domain